MKIKLLYKYTKKSFTLKRNKDDIKECNSFKCQYFSDEPLFLMKTKALCLPSVVVVDWKQLRLI